MSFIDEYYKRQAGNGIAGFTGVRYQKGHGFFGRLLSGAVLPFLKFIGKNALSAGANIARDLVDTDDFSLSNIRNKAKARFKESAASAMKTGAEKLLTGQGIKRRRRNKRRYKKKVIKVKRPRRITKKTKPRKKKIVRKKLKNCFLD